MQKELFSISPDGERDNFSIERELYAGGYSAVAGTDEAGRGPLAGPVVAASVILPMDCDHTIFKDSKQLSAAARKDLRLKLLEIGAVIGLGIGTEEEIDRLNILHASLLAMKKSMEALTTRPDYLLVDGKFPIPHSIAQQSLIKGESKSASIAAASIVAKEERDRIMKELGEQYPEYNFVRHKGYPTAEHRELIKKFGPSPVHRKSFKGVREHLRTAHDCTSKN